MVIANFNCLRPQKKIRLNFKTRNRLHYNGWVFMKVQKRDTDPTVFVDSLPSVFIHKLVDKKCWHMESSVAAAADESAIYCAG